MCDLGGGHETNCDEPASKALVFMVNFVNDRFKVPISHYFVDTLNGKGEWLLISTRVSRLFVTAIYTDYNSNNSVLSPFIESIRLEGC